MAHIGKYEIISPLATGGMAQLFLARQCGPKGFQKTVVIKQLHRNLAQDANVVQMFVDEARIAARLNHTNIINIFDLGSVDGNFFIAMEYVQGHDLAEIMNQAETSGHIMPYSLASYIISRVCCGLHFAHILTDELERPLEIVHRDISPQNILISFQGIVKLADFGIAKASSRAAESNAGILKGKYAYMSPEQCKGQDVDARSDIFSAGILLYELICRRRLFRRDTDFATMRAVVEDPIPPPSAMLEDVPDELEHIILRSLARRPAERYQDAQEMHHELEEAIRVNGWSVGTAEATRYMIRLFPHSQSPEERDAVEDAEDEVYIDESATVNLSRSKAAVTAKAKKFLEAVTAENPELDPELLQEDPPTSPVLDPLKASPTGGQDRDQAAAFAALLEEEQTVISPPGFEETLLNEDQAAALKIQSALLTSETGETPTDVIPNTPRVELDSGPLTTVGPPANLAEDLHEYAPPGAARGAALDIGVSESPTKEIRRGDATEKNPPRSEALAQGLPPEPAGRSAASSINQIFSMAPEKAPEPPTAAEPELSFDADEAHQEPPTPYYHPSTPQANGEREVRTLTMEPPLKPDLWARILTNASTPRSPKKIALIAGALSLGLGLVLLLLLRSSPATVETTVAITSTPPGAAVYLNGKKQFGTTPLTLREMALDSELSLVVIKDGFKPWHEKLQLSAQQPQQQLTVELKPTAENHGQATLVLKVKQGDAKIFLNGEMRGLSPLTLEGVPAGVSQTIIIKKAGFEDKSLQLTALKAQERRVIEVDLAQERPSLLPRNKQPARKGRRRPPQTRGAQGIEIPPQPGN